MKTKKLSILYPAVFAIASILVSCSSVTYAGDSRPFIESQRITINGVKDPITVNMNKETQCPQEVVGVPGETIPRKEFFSTVAKRGAKIENINIVGARCDSFIADVPGASVWFCTPNKCYCIAQCE